MVGLPEHGVEAVQGHVLTQQPVREPVDLQQPLQLLARENPWLLRAGTPLLDVSPADNLLTAHVGTGIPPGPVTTFPSSEEWKEWPREAACLSQDGDH